jgi:serine/threonine-protein kinase
MSWGPGNTIVIGSFGEGLIRTSANGGSPEPLTRVTGKGESHRWPFVLPNGRGVLFTVWTGSLDAARIAVVSLDTGTVTTLVPGTAPRYSPTAHLLYAAGPGLRAVGFDADRLALNGEKEATILEGVHVDQRTGAAYYGLADNGTLVYYASPPASNRVTLALVDAAGDAQAIGVPGTAYQYPRVSRDGLRVAYQAEYSDGPGIAVFEIGGRTEPKS